MFQMQFMEKIETQILFSVTFSFFFLENRAVYEVKWKNMLQP